MTVENDGLPPSEGDDHEPVGDGTLDPPTELLPLDAATATRLSAADAADADARQAQLNAPVDPAPPATQPTRSAAAAPPAEVVPSEAPTQVLPLEHQAGQPTPPAVGTPTQGTVEGDLFDSSEQTGRGVS